MPRLVTSRAAALGAAALVVLGTACNPSTTRPRFAPMRGAVVDTVLALPEVVTQRIAAMAEAEGLEARRVSIRDGFVELLLARVDSVPFAGPSTASQERDVRLRVWADPLPGGRTRVTAEAVYRRRADPSLTPRDTEAMVPDDHPALALLGRLVEAAKANGR